MKSLSAIRADLIDYEYPPTLKGWLARHDDRVSSGEGDIYWRQHGEYLGSKPWYTASVWLNLRQWGIGADISRHREHHYAAKPFHIGHTVATVQVGPLAFALERERVQ